MTEVPAKETDDTGSESQPQLKPRPKGWRIRWWGWGCIILLFVASILFAVAFAIRSSGLQAYQEAVDELAADGFGADLDDLAPWAVGIDAERQREWHSWHTMVYGGHPDFDRLEELGSLLEGEELQAYLQGTGPLPQEIADILDANRPVVVTPLGLLREGKVNPGVLGSYVLHQDEIVDGWAWAVAWDCANLLTSRSLANYLSGEALRAEDPTPFLADFDALVASMEPAVTLIDGMVAIALCDMRDDAWLLACRRNRLSREQAEAWLTGPPDRRVSIADALRGERLVFFQSVVGGILYHASRHEVDDIYYYGGSGWLNRMEHWTQARLTWVFLGGDAAHALRAYRDLEAHCRDPKGHAAPDIAEVNAEMWLPVSKIFLPNIDASIQTVDEAGMRQLAKRLAGKLYLDLHAGQALPVDQAELQARYPADWTAMLGFGTPRYTLDADGTFRLENCTPSVHVRTMVDSKTWP